MSKRKKGLFAIVLATSILCMGTRTANAGVIETSVCNYDVWAETYLSGTVAMARTQCESYDAYTTVSAVFYYIDRDTMFMVPIGGYHEGNYCAIVNMSLPSGNNEAYEIRADHTVEYAVGSAYGYWSDSTSDMAD